LSACVESNALLNVLINHTTILAPALPQVPRTATDNKSFHNFHSSLNATKVTKSRRRCGMAYSIRRRDKECERKITSEYLKEKASRKTWHTMDNDITVDLKINMVN